MAIVEAGKIAQPKHPFQALQSMATPISSEANCCSPRGENMVDCAPETFTQDFGLNAAQRCASSTVASTPTTKGQRQINSILEVPAPTAKSYSKNVLKVTTEGATPTLERDLDCVENTSSDTRSTVNNIGPDANFASEVTIDKTTNTVRSLRPRDVMALSISTSEGTILTCAIGSTSETITILNQKILKDFFNRHRNGANRCGVIPWANEGIEFTDGKKERGR